MDPEKDPDDLLEAMEEDPYEVRDSQETRYRQAESMGMGKHQSEILASRL